MERLGRERLPGVKFRPASFIPTFDKYQGQSCAGAMIHVVDRQTFLPLRTGIAIFRVAHELGGQDFQWRADAYEFVDQVPAFDLLCGTDQVRKGIEAGHGVDQLTAGFDAELATFVDERKRHLLYD